MKSKHMKNDEEYNKNIKNYNRLNKNRNNKKRKKSKKGKIIKRIILLIFLIIIICVAVFAGKVASNGGGLKGFLATLVGQTEETRKSMQEIQVLILGESLNLTDTIMIGRYDPNAQKASLISVQRDTFIGDNPNYATAYDKINSVYQGKYPENSLKEINELTGLNLQYYVVVDTEALRELVDLIGGVEFDVPIDMKYKDKKQGLYIDLKAGKQVLNGDQAEQLLRFRHNSDGTTYPASYGTQDTGRMRTQRNFISELIKQTVTPNNILKLGEFIDIANKYVKTNIPIDLLKDYIPYAVEFPIDNLVTDALPGEAKQLNGVWLYLTDTEEAQKMIAEQFFDCPNEENINPEMPTVQILNGTDNPEKLKEVVNKYKEKGYNVLMVGNAEKTAKTTKVTNLTGKTKDEAKAVRDVISEDAKIVTDKDKDSEVDFKITIGEDF